MTSLDLITAAVTWNLADHMGAAISLAQVTEDRRLVASHRGESTYAIAKLIVSILVQCNHRSDDSAGAGKL